MALAGEDVWFRRDGGVLPDYFRVSVGASWNTRLINRFPKIVKPWKQAKNDHGELSSEVRMITVVMVLSVSWA